MKIETREIYKCDHCKKLYQRKNACAYHEVRCKKNPANWRACMSCIYSEKIAAGIIDRHGNEKDVQVLHCKKKDVYLYPPSMEHKGFYYEMMDEKENVPMPKECEEQTMEKYEFDPW